MIKKIETIEDIENILIKQLYREEDIENILGENKNTVKMFFAYGNDIIRPSDIIKLSDILRDKDINIYSTLTKKFEHDGNEYNVESEIFNSFDSVLDMLSKGDVVIYNISTVRSVHPKTFEPHIDFEVIYSYLENNSLNLKKSA